LFHPGPVPEIFTTQFRKRYDVTDIGDVILVYIEDQPAFFGRIEDVIPDIKPGWVRLKFLILQIPPTLGEWILRPDYVQGDEFSMGGRKVKIEKVVAPVEVQEPDPDPESAGSRKVIPLRKEWKF
jgi:hypothetical protein